jgi:hypothetical protein
MTSPAAAVIRRSRRLRLRLLDRGQKILHPKTGVMLYIVTAPAERISDGTYALGVKTAEGQATTLRFERNSFLLVERREQGNQGPGGEPAIAAQVGGNAT